jgi:hypothetical protein
MVYLKAATWCTVYALVLSIFIIAYGYGNTYI